MHNSPKNFRVLRGGGGNEGGDQPINEAMQEMRAEQAASQSGEEFTENPSEPPERQLSAREEIELIKRENLTGRQLRIARRLAQRHNLTPTSDLDAVRLLRRQGIDPFGKQEIAQVLTPDNMDGEPDAGVALPATIRKTAVSEHRPPVIDNDSRDREVSKIQRDLVKRRRKRLAQLIVKLACYVMLPSIIAGYYFYKVATPMYATYTEFVIQTAAAPGITGAASLFKGSPFETVTDSITVQGYLTSRDAMLRLDRDLGFRKLFQSDDVDVLQRLDASASNEDAYKIYKKHVIIGFDPTEGVIKMEVISPSPESSKAISKALISYAEERVDQLTERLRADQMQGAREIYDDAEAKVDLAFDEVAALQKKSKTLNAQQENALVSTQIGSLETQITEKQLELSRLMANARPNETKVTILEAEIVLLKDKVVEKRQQISQGSGEGESIVDINSDLSKAEGKLLLRQQLVATALQNLEMARVEATRQTRYISMGVSPVTPDQATYPRAFENTLLAIVVFAGIYLMMSLTISILREQVTT